jgi:hypothetical protein
MEYAFGMGATGNKKSVQEDTVGIIKGPKKMKKIARIIDYREQDQLRMADTALMTPDERVAALINFQRQYYGENDGKIIRVATIKNIANK